MKATRLHIYQIPDYGQILFDRRDRNRWRVVWIPLGAPDPSRGTSIAWLREDQKPSATLAVDFCKMACAIEDGHDQDHYLNKGLTPPPRRGPEPVEGAEMSTDFPMKSVSRRSMSLQEQINQMVDDGALLIWQRRGTREFLGRVVVEEAEKRLFFMRIWPEGTGSVHILRWDKVAWDAHRVLFYRADGQLKGVITRMREFPEFDQKQLPLDMAEWKQEFKKHEADYMRFLRSEMEVLKDAQDLDSP